MDAATTMMSNTFPDTGKLSKGVSVGPEQHDHITQPEEISEGWDALDVDDKAQKEVILHEHFLKAFERFNAGVSLAKIRRHYEKLGAKYSPVTFRKKWTDLVKQYTEQV